MKDRRLSAIVIVFILAVSLLSVSRYFKSQKMAISNDIKSQLTRNETLTIPAETKIRSLKSIIASSLKKQESMNEKKELEDKNLLSRARDFTETEIDNMSELEFRDLLKETESKLPTITDLKVLPPGALHHTPAPIIQAGRDLGLLKDILKVHESYARDAVIFYETCAKTKERPMSIKALCLTNLIEINKKNGVQVNLSRYPKEIVELTKLITDL